MTRTCLVALLLLACVGRTVQTEAATRVTILTDAFGKSSTLEKDWGFAALIEHDGVRILFDTGNDAERFRHNVEALKVDLTRLDFVVISHRHGDHTDGLRHLLRVNPRVKIYVPNDEYFGGPTPQVFFRPAREMLPEHMRYFDGKAPASIPHGSPWKEANVERVEGTAQVGPGISLVGNLSRGDSFTETPEVSLAIDTPQGRILIVGCSHPGIEQILESVEAKRRPVRVIVGGLHWVMADEREIERLATGLRDAWGVVSVAPGHCTGEAGFAALQRTYGSRYVYAGLGTAIDFN